MANIITETTGDRVTVSAVPGSGKDFAATAKALAEAGTVGTETGDRGIVLVTDLETAKKAGVVKATRTNRKKAE